MPRQTIIFIYKEVHSLMVLGEKKPLLFRIAL